MKFIFLYISNLFSRHTRFAFMMVFIQILAMLAVCFSVGVLYNNQFSLMDDEERQRSIYFYFDDLDIKIEDIEPMLERIYDIFDGDTPEITTMAVFFDDETGRATVIAASGVFDGEKYSLGETVTQALAYQIESGRNLTQEDYDNESLVALVSGNVTDETFTHNGTTFQVVGYRSMYTEETDPFLYYVPITLDFLPVQDIALGFDRLPTYDEYNELKAILEEDCPCGFTLDDYYGGDADYDAMVNSISICVSAILIAMVGTLLMIGGFLWSLRKKELAVKRLTGCKRQRIVRDYVTENIIISLPSLVAGMGLFVLVLRAVSGYYPYMKKLFDLPVYMACFMLVFGVIVLQAVVLAAVKTRVSVREQLRGGLL